MIRNIQNNGKVTLAQLRALNGLTQKTFAEFAGISYAAYRRCEKNSNDACISEIVQICNRAGIEIEQLLL